MFEWLFGKTWEPERDIPSLKGKVFFVTGGEYTAQTLPPVSSTTY